jgi:hypothetical protein
MNHEQITTTALELCAPRFLQSPASDPGCAAYEASMVPINDFQPCSLIDSPESAVPRRRLISSSLLPPSSPGAARAFFFRAGC